MCITLKIEWWMEDGSRSSQVSMDQKLDKTMVFLSRLLLTQDLEFAGGKVAHIFQK